MVIESAVRKRYSGAARQAEAALCCPVNYDPKYLKVIPAEVIERDYGCGDPSRWVREGDTVLDLGSGTGKICFIAAQVVGPKGRVIGVDMTDDMLEVARRNAPVVAKTIGYANVEFRKGRIQDMGLDLALLDQRLGEMPFAGAEGWLAAEKLADELRRDHPLVPDNSVDVVVSNCVLNLVDAASKPKLFSEIFRVLCLGGRAVISDIVSDEPVPAEMQRDSDLWSGCISGALTETEFIQAFEQAGFYGIEIVKRDDVPWRTVGGIEFRSVTLRAYKGKEGACFERNQAVIYKGPFKEVLDDDGHRLRRGVRHAVCDKTFQLYRKDPYRAYLDFVEPQTSIPLDAAQPFDCRRSAPRQPRETKGLDYKTTTDASVCRDGGNGACC